VAAPPDILSSGASSPEGVAPADRPGVGRHAPVEPGNHPAPRLDLALLAGLREVPSLSSELADLLDEWGWNMAGRDPSLVHRAGPRLMIGQAVTLSYLPERNLGEAQPPGHLAHHTAAALGHPGDVLVISTAGILDASVLGGQGARAIASRGMAGAVVDGAMRDVDEVREAGIAAWSRSVTPQSGVGRLEAVSIQRPISCAGVQVHPGDLVVADEAGVVFLPSRLVALAASRLLGPRQAGSG